MRKFLLTKDSKKLLEKYVKRPIVPIVLILRGSGKEYDRICGYPDACQGGNPEKYQKRLENIINGTRDLTSLKKEFKKKKNDMEFVYSIAIEYLHRHKIEEAVKVFEHIIKNKDKSIEIWIPLGEGKSNLYHRSVINRRVHKAALKCRSNLDMALDKIK